MEREGGNVKQPKLYSMINHKLPYVQAKRSDRRRVNKAPYMYLQNDDYFPFGQACEEVCHVGVPRWGDVIVAKGIPPGSIKPTRDDHQLWIILDM